MADLYLLHKAFAVVGIPARPVAASVAPTAERHVPIVAQDPKTGRQGQLYISEAARQALAARGDHLAHYDKVDTFVERQQLAPVAIK